MSAIELIENHLGRVRKELGDSKERMKRAEQEIVGEKSIQARLEAEISELSEAHIALSAKK